MGCSCWIKFAKCWNICFLRWRAWIRPFVILVYLVVLLILLPLLVLNCAKGQCSRKDQSELIGGVFTLLAIPISFWEITQHLVHYNKPYLQQHVIRILWMVPIYALDSWLGLMAPRVSIYMNSMRECFEAYVIYNFMKFLLNYLNAEMNLEENLELKPQVHHLFPLSLCFRDWEMGREIVHKCKHGILQYTLIRPIMAAIAFLCEMGGVYGEDEYKPGVAYPYIIAVNNVSQFIAMYCLVLFYKTNKTELADMKPIGKFLCIKSVVFFSFFQEFTISILVNFNVISDVFGTTDSGDIKVISSSLQNFLICIEMFLAAIAHHYCFSYKDYVDMAASTPNCCESFVHMWDISDVKSDVAEHVNVVRNTVRNVIPSTVYRHAGGKGEERARLLSISDGVDYQSGNESGPGRSSSILHGPFQSARPGSLHTVEVDFSGQRIVGRHEDGFTELSDYENEDQNRH